jgi:pimeloyl-ACP methyl ester carboxylesterase
VLVFDLMAARTSQDEQKRRRRSRLAKGLLLGGAAIGLPALANALIARRGQRLGRPTWGRADRYAWKFGEIAFQRLGDGAPLLLLHSFGPGHDSEEWRPAGELLAQQYRVFALDFLGWGRSDKPRIAYDGELYIQLVGDFLEDVVGESAVLVAAGLAGSYAVQCAVDHPERTGGLALVVPTGIEVHSDEPDLRDALVHRLLRLPLLGTSALNLLTSRAALSQYLRREVFRGPEQVDAARVEQHYRSSHQPGAHAALAAYLSGYLNHPVDEALRRLGTPLWIAWGRNAATPPLETADLWLHRVPEARLEVLDNSSSLPHLEVSARFSQRLGEFLATLPV